MRNTLGQEYSNVQAFIEDIIDKVGAFTTAEDWTLGVILPTNSPVLHADFLEKLKEFLNGGFKDLYRRWETTNDVNDVPVILPESLYSLPIGMGKEVRPPSRGSSGLFDNSKPSSAESTPPDSNHSASLSPGK